MDPLETTEVKIQLVAAVERASTLIHFRAVIDFCSELSLHRVQESRRHIEVSGQVPQSSSRSITSTVTAKSQVRRAQREHVGSIVKVETHPTLGKAGRQLLSTHSVSSMALCSEFIHMA